MFDAATVTVQITKCHSLITFSRANSSFVLLSWFAVCVAPPLAKAFGLTTATWITLEPPSDLCTLSFSSTSFVFLSHVTFLLGQVLFLGFGEYLTTEESLQISDPCFFQLVH
ncbi:hypothetical protein V8C43DRAFT_81214 [Trichoderma afarasin]